MPTTFGPEVSLEASKKNLTAGAFPERHLELLRTEFQQIKKVDQVEQTFGLRILIMLRIHDGALDPDLCCDMEEKDGSLVNKDGEPKRGSARWHLSKLSWRNGVADWEKRTVQKAKNNLDLVYEMDGTFFELFELHHFPFDHQMLRAKLRSACAMDGKTPVRFTKRRQGVIQLIDRENFALHNAWTLEERIQAVEGIYQYGGEFSGKEYPSLEVTLHVHRKSGYYLINVVIPTSLLALTSMLQWRVPAEDVTDRLQQNYALLLTAVAYKLVTAQMLPTVSYLTLLDKFVAFETLIILLSCFEGAFAEGVEISNGFNSGGHFTVGGENFDKGAMWACVGLWIFSHAYFGGRAWLIRRKTARERRDRESQREKKDGGKGAWTVFSTSMKSMGQSSRKGSCSTKVEPEPATTTSSSAQLGGEALLEETDLQVLGPPGGGD